MPRVQHVARIARPKSFRSDKIMGMFDVPPSDILEKHFDIDHDIEGKPWSVGVIVGPSGAGKTTIAKKIFGEVSKPYDFPNDGSVVDGFPNDMSVNDICSSLSAVGFSSPPAWLLPYKCLSNGQQFRAQLARAMMADDRCVFDEFTSVVDRTVAKACASCVAKSTRKNGRQFVAVTCHYDVIEWLEPDWVIDMQDCTFSRRSLQRPRIAIEIHEASTNVWPIFAGHHYLSGDIHKAAKVYVALMDGRMTAMCSDLHFVHPSTRDIRRIHRLVTLPDFQGFGIGPRLLDFVATKNRKEGKRTCITTSHPGLVRFLDGSSKWKCTRKPDPYGCKRGSSSSQKNAPTAFGRMVCSFEYCGT